MTGTVNIESLRPGTAEQNCAGCTFWSQWLENTGDCMRYATKRRESYGTAETPLPQLSARATSGGQVCDDHEPAPPPTHKRCTTCDGTGKVPA